MAIVDGARLQSELLQKIGAYGASDPKLLEIAASICAKRPLSSEQQQYVADFEAQLAGEHPHSLWGPLRL